MNGALRTRGCSAWLRRRSYGGDRLRWFLGSYKKAFATFGFSNFVIAEFPLPGDNLRDVILLKKLPGGWLELYARKDYLHADPVARYARRRQTPFAWADAPYNKETEVRAHEIMCLASDFGMASGYCVPARLFQRDMCVSLSGGQVELTRHTKPAIQFMALYALDGAIQLAGSPSMEEKCLLTARESEVLHWAAAGKSAGETADILNISERTVIAHAVNAMNKLGAANKTQAVVRAIQRRYITPDL